MRSYWKFASFYSALIISMTIHASGISEASNKWPSCIGAMCFEKSLPEAKTAISYFGRFSFINNADEEVFCFKNKNNYISITAHQEKIPYVSSVTLSSFPICNGPIHTSRKLGSLGTTEQLLLQQPITRVFEIYGRPNVVEVGASTLGWQEAALRINEVSESSDLVYGPTTESSLFQATIFIRHGKVAGIELSNSE